MKGFTFYMSYYDVAQELTPRQQAEFYRAIIDYMFSGHDPEDGLKGNVRMCFKAIKANLKTSKLRSESGSKGVAKRWDATKQSDSKPIANAYQVQVQDKDKYQVQGDCNEPPGVQMPPTVRAELESRGLLKVVK